MTDTVKLIIEIPKDYYEVLSKTEVILTSQRSGKTFMSVIYSAVKNGIPLDDVKKEIDQLPLVLLAGNYHIDKDYVMEILDRIGRK